MPGGSRVSAFCTLTFMLLNRCQGRQREQTKSINHSVSLIFCHQHASLLIWSSDFLFIPRSPHYSLSVCCGGRELFILALGEFTGDVIPASSSVQPHALRLLSFLLPLPTSSASSPGPYPPEMAGGKCVAWGSTLPGLRSWLQVCDLGSVP